MTATPTPIVAPTPTLMPDGCVRPLINGGFETAGGWVLHGNRPPRDVTTVVHSGQQGELLGILPGEANEYTYSTLWQPLLVPDDATTMAVAAWTWQAAEPGGGPDRQLMLIYDVDPDANQQGQRSPIAYVFGERLDARTWQRRTLTIDVTAYRGQPLWVYATVLNDGLGGRAWMYLDDVEVAFCP